MKLEEYSKFFKEKQGSETPYFLFDIVWHCGNKLKKNLYHTSRDVWFENAGYLAGVYRGAGFVIF